MHADALGLVREDVIISKRRDRAGRVAKTRSTWIASPRPARASRTQHAASLPGRARRRRAAREPHLGPRGAELGMPSKRPVPAGRAFAVERTTSVSRRAAA